MENELNIEMSGESDLREKVLVGAGESLPRAGKKVGNCSKIEVTSKGTGIPEDELNTPETLSALLETDAETEICVEQMGHPSVQRRQGYVNHMHRDEDIMEEKCRGTKRWELTRIVAKRHQLPCANGPAIRSFEVLAPNGNLIAETLIPRDTLDAYQAVWQREDNPPSLVDFLLQYADPDSLEFIEQEKACTHLLKETSTKKTYNDYIQYRIAEMKQADRFGTLTFSNWLRMHPQRKGLGRMCMKAAVRLQASRLARMVDYW